MFSRTARFFFLLFCFGSCTAPREISKSDTQTYDNLKAHIQYLADDKLEGRRTGTPGEKLAIDYISAQFKTIGLLPKGEDGYKQPFPVDDGKRIGDATQFSINGNSLLANRDFFPFVFSPDKTIDATPAISVKESGMPWFYDLKEPLEDNNNNPHFDLNEHIIDYAKKAAAGGASAVIIYNTATIDDDLKYNAKDKTAQTSIPVFYLYPDAAKKYLGDKFATLTVKLRSELVPSQRTGYNVIGYIDNGAVNTVVLGAHFDHLGYGEDGNSMLRTGEKLIHNGADDNASGTAALIELARKLKVSKATHNNYLFIAFSGEELGLFGSKFFTEHPTIDLSKISCMINMDMVGRLNDSSKVLTVGGYGTSPVWGEYFSSHTSSAAFTIKFDSSGTGPSDHTSFYRKDIPVLFYFTGIHKDYHKPTDDADKINYKGELAIVQQILILVESLNDKGKLPFAKTRETQMSNMSFKVTLGIMPDYTFSGAGVRADGVSDGRPAQKAGLKAGDIIVQLGDNHVSSLDTYMQALGKFKKGDKTRVKFKRGDQVLEANIEF